MDGTEPPRKRETTMANAKKTTTTEPVTMSGWYENTDGSVTRYDWQSGQLVTGATAANWAQVPRELARDTRAIGVHGITGQDTEEGILPAGTVVRNIETEQTIDGTVTRFEALNGGSWYRQRTFDRVETI